MSVLNMLHFARSYQQAQAAFAPGWVQTTPASVPSALAKADEQSVVATPLAPTPAPPPLAEPTPPDDPTVKIAAALSSAGLKPTYAALYLAVQAKTGTPWELLAAVHRIETGQRGDTAITSYAGAQGPMQFMPATFKAYAVDGDNNGITQITGVDDAMYTAGHYLGANGAASHSYREALYHYNHSTVYVSDVMAIAWSLGLR